MDEENITILVDGEPKATYIDKHGVQRFVPSEVLVFLWENDQVDLNQLFRAFMKGDFTLEAYQEFYQDIGFSVGGFEEVFGAGSGIANETGNPCIILNPLEGHGQTIQ